MQYEEHTQAAERWAVSSCEKVAAVIQIKGRYNQEATWSPQFACPQPRLNFPLATVSDAWHLCVFTASLLAATGCYRRCEQGVNPVNGGRRGLDQGHWPEQSSFHVKMCPPQLRRQKENLGNSLAGFLTYPAGERRVCICNRRVAAGELWGVRGEV